MAEYIDRDAVLAKLSDKNAAWDGYAKVKAIPAADVIERKHGRWIWDDEGFHCSECFFHAYGNTGEILSGDYHFCPNCGTRMESEGEA